MLLIHGEGDRLIPIASSEWYADQLAHARLIRYAATGHWLMIEQPQRFADDVRAFLRE